MTVSLPEIYRQLIREFTVAWSTDDPPVVSDYLARAREQTTGSRLASDFVWTLIEIDLVNRIHRGSDSASCVEDYLELLKQHCGQVAVPDALIAEEYRARMEAGQQPSVQQYLQRFVRGDSLAKRLQAIQQVELEPDATEVGGWAPVAPKILGNYRIERELGRGGMGVVYKAVPIDGGPAVALKTLQNQTSGSLTKFKREFRVLADLTHPNLVRLGELVTTAIEPFFTMEIIDGTSFTAHIRSGFDTAAANPHLPYHEGRLREALAQLAGGLQALHQVGCIHRDIKPSNVLVTSSGRVVLLDFGLAVDARQRPGELAGTPLYMAPEQAQGKAVTAAADSYAVGVMLFESLTGERPFRGRLWDELLAQKLAAQRPAPRDLQSSIPEDLNALCVDLLQVDPARRPDAAQILQRLTGGSAAADSNDVWIGREGQLTTLQQAYNDVDAGHPAVVLVSGSSGVGKTALVDRFLRELHHRAQVVILRGRCYENESVPFRGFDSVIDALVQHLSRLPDNEVERVLPLELEPLCQIFPALLEVRAIANNQTSRRAYSDPRERRQQGLSALREMLSRLTRWAAVVIFIDDIQWGDDDTATLLRELLRRDAAPPLLFIATYRSEEAQSDCLQQIRRSQLPPSQQAQWVDQIELSVDRLEPPEALRLAVDLLAQHDLHDRSLAQQIAREADGDPLFIRVFVREIAEAASDSDGPQRQIASWTLQDVLWKQVCDLDPVARTAIELLAVAARPLAIVDLEAVACEDQDKIGMTSSLRVKRMIRRLADHRSVETYHDKIRETVLDHLSPATRAEHCRSLAQRLETASQPDVEFLADLYRRGGDLLRSGQYYVRAAQSSADKLAFTSAVQYYRRALEQLQLTPAQEQQLRTRLGDALANVSRASEAAQQYLLAAALADADERPRLYQNAALRLLTSGHVDEGIDALKVALRDVALPWPNQTWQAVGGLLLRMARLRMRRLQPAQRETSVAVDQQRALDVCWSAAAGLSLVDPVRGAFYVTENLIRSLDAGNTRFLSRDLAAYMGHAAIGGNRSRREVKRVLTASRELSRIDAHPYTRALTLTARGIAALLRGDWPITLRACDHAIEHLNDDRCQDIGWELNSARTFALWALQYQGDLVELSRRQPALLRTALETDDHFAILNFRTQVMTHLLTAADQPDQAEESLRRDGQLLSDRGFFVQHHNHVLASTYLQIYRGQGMAAWETVAPAWQRYRGAFLSQVQQVRIDHFQVFTRAALAAAAESPADRERMLKYAAAGIRRLEKERAPWASALAQAFKASWQYQTGQTAQATDTLGTATASLRRVHMHLFATAAAHCHQRLQSVDPNVATELAKQWTQMNVQAPERMADMLIPGLSPQQERPATDL